MKSIVLFLEQNAPELAYQTVYNKSIPLRGRIFAKEKKYKEFMVDYQLKNEWLDKINSIKGIEIRSTCAGHSKERVPFIIFRPLNQNKNYVEKIVNNLRKCPNTFVSYDIGRQNLYRICVATNYNNWKNWWENIGDCISREIIK